MPRMSTDKGFEFERRTCRQLSLWITHGERSDVFWRTATSGARATMALRRGESVRQAGDICAVAPEGHALMDLWYLELKSYKNLEITSFVLRGRGLLSGFWRTTVAKAAAHGHPGPVLIAHQNLFPTILLMPETDDPWVPPRAVIELEEGAVELHLLDEFLAVPPPREAARRLLTPRPPTEPPT